MRKTWKTLRAVITVIVALLAFSLVIELIHAYEILRDAGRWLGWTYLLVLAGLVGWGVVVYVRNWLRYPPVAVPPPPCDLLEADRAVLCRHARYRRRIMIRLQTNENLSDEMHERLNRHVSHLGAALDRGQSAGMIYDALQDVGSEALEPAMQALDQLAEREVQRCVRDVMLGVTLSPWRSVDVGVVIYRNVSMVLRVAALYNSRPRMLEQLLVLRDVLMVVATVNFLNYGSRLLQNLAGSVPVLGRFADDLAQGVGAGLLTSMAGHAALARCRCYQGWETAEAQERLRARLTSFVNDVKGIVLSDVMPMLRRPVEAQVEDVAREPDWFEKARERTGRAIDETSVGMTAFIRRPVVAAGRGVLQTGSRVADLVAQGASAGWQGVRQGTSRVRDVTDAGVRRGSRTVRHACDSTSRAAKAGFSRVRRAGGHLSDRLRQRRGSVSEDVSVDEGAADRQPEQRGDDTDRQDSAL